MIKVELSTEELEELVYELPTPSSKLKIKLEKKLRLSRELDKFQSLKDDE